MTEEVKIIEAELSDIDEILDIYTYYVENTLSCFEENAPQKQKMINLLNFIRSKDLAFYVAKIDGKVVGYSYATQYRRRSAYKYTVESSVYLHPDFTGKGIAKKLLNKVIEDISAKGFKQMIAVVVVQDNRDSINFHKKMGFEKKGHLEKVGYKFGKWLDINLFQKSL